MFVKREYSSSHPEDFAKLKAAEKFGGAEFVAHIYGLCRKPIIVMNNSRMSEKMIEELKKAGAVAFIKTPFQGAHLTDVFRRILTENGYTS